MGPTLLLSRQRPNEWPGGCRAAEPMDVSETLRPEVDVHPPPWQNVEFATTDDPILGENL